MDQAKRANEASTEENERGIPECISEVRTLSELELVLCGGGDSIIYWPH